MREGQHGLGVYALGPFVAGEVLARASGHIEPQHRHTIQTGLQTHVLVDAPIVYLNHSCAPNAYLEALEDETEITLRAAQSIEAGDELLIDYATFELDTLEFASTACGCGAANCRGRTLGFRALSAAERARLLPLCVAYLQRVAASL